MLLSHCNNVISAEVPQYLQRIALAIPNKNKFISMPNTEALHYLRSGQAKEASVLFETFLHQYGHRGYREMDPFYSPWAKEPTQCVQSIKVFLIASD